MLKTLKIYLSKIFQGAQVIVFPEDGLTGWSDINDNTIFELSTEIPDPAQQISPCTAQTPNYSKGLVDLSCSARAHKIYVAANLIERHYDLNHQRIYHNANVVFDRNGTVIARYRKINLFNEDIFHAGTDIVTFKTDFGVTFGMFICFDIMFKQPGFNVLLDPAVTDIVYSVAWFSELPFLQGFGVQHGYVASTGVNLLAAGMHQPATANGGSAIYLSGGKIASSYISGTNSSKMIIEDVPIISSRDPSGSCQRGAPTGRQLNLKTTENSVPDIHSFHTYEEDMDNYTFRSLNLDNQVITDVICSEETGFCCSFNITINEHSTSQSDYVYKLVAFHGSRLISSRDTAGVRVCALVACLNESNISCGGRHRQYSTGVNFESISIKGTFDLKDSHDNPFTVNFSLKPVTEYSFCKRRIGDKVEVSLATAEPHDSLLTFGIQGRVFSNDNKPTGTIPVNSS